MSGVELITRRRMWSATQNAALLEEVEFEGGKVAAVARRHGISESLLYNWRSAWKSAASAVSAAESVAFFLSVLWAKRAGRNGHCWRPRKRTDRQRLRPARTALERSRLHCRTASAVALLGW